ncbi:MAG TPA: lipid IV(A) 3-deoxy-D-manno-octulosonic acid transferase [Steroidobacteraceae bacterium]|nr:lipid IV(A) 3-deoxy-D-manno-octulosonic acid transferase [Steroidobacteraceae bacterium]
MIFRLTSYLLAPFYLAALLWRGRRDPGSWRGLGQRFGLGAVLHSPVWLHAASVGEVHAAAILVAALRERDAQLPLLVTTTTAAGLARAQALFAASGISVRYVPLDLPGAVRRFLVRVRPRLAIVLETEIWPNLFRACGAAGVPLVLASARISEASARRYRWLGGALREALAGVAQVAAQTQTDAQRFAALGVPPPRITVTGNLKADFAVPDSVLENGSRLRARLSARRPVWVAGSTHDLEEQQVLDAHRAVRAAHPEALLVLVPRHPRRFEAVAEWLRREQIPFARQSRADPVTAATQVLLVDAMGLLLECYAAGDVAFVGGSLVAVGGHNLLEPAALARPILTGPSHANAREILQALLAAQAVRVVHDAAELGHAVTALLRDADARQRLGVQALQVVAAGRGSCARVMALLPASG